ncbi:glycosyl transferase [Phycicoccus flavus]|uniref:glycosyl transferase n=1 Tax=Phycicoccus flavus TaxID=2502783 RepID=UPI000FEBB328|nr:glycosyl transferase [Phycicoccus flavus]NHA66770.1 glycosyl transferase [Phycicoccus flavus]
MFAIRSRAGRLVRRAGLLPGGVADGLGEDHRLGDLVLRTRVVVFFPDPPENLYQLREWLGPLEALDAELGVTLLTQDSRTAAALRSETRLAVHVTAATRTVGRLLAEGDVALVLYVGQANANAVALRSADVAHVFLNHGESDKVVSVSNQAKAFDFVFVGGQAAVERHRAGLLFFDAGARLRTIGRPQVPPPATPQGPTSVLYAPTWEGTLAVNAYSSVRAYGETLVRSVLRDTSHRLVYRPHPRTGVSDRSYAAADRRIREVLAAHPGRARVDTGPAAAAMHAAHVMVADTSAIATDWLSQGRPLVSTEAADPRARVARPARLHERTPHIGPGTAERAGEIVDAALADPDAAATLDELFHYYLGGLDARASLAAFVAACHEVVALRDAARERTDAP